MNSSGKKDRSYNDDVEKGEGERPERHEASHPSHPSQRGLTTVWPAKIMMVFGICVCVCVCACVRVCVHACVCVSG